MTDQLSFHVFNEAEILNFLAVGILENQGVVESTQQQIDSAENLIKSLIFGVTRIETSH